MAGGGNYFRIVCPTPMLEFGDRVYYTEDGYIRGFATICEIRRKTGKREKIACQTTGKYWQVPKGGCVIIMDARSWCWIKPIKMTGFQGWRYMRLVREVEIHVVGGWLDPRPAVTPSHEEARTGIAEEPPGAG